MSVQMLILKEWLTSRVFFLFLVIYLFFSQYKYGEVLDYFLRASFEKGKEVRGQGDGTAGKWGNKEPLRTRRQGAEVRAISGRPTFPQAWPSQSAFPT